MGDPAAAANPASSGGAGFEFIRVLAEELSRGKVDLPSFPEIAVRVRRVLADERSSVNQVVRVVGSEPALAARLLKMSNSASLNRNGKQVTDLRTAINRMGYNMVRSAAISFAMAQIRSANKLAGLESHLDHLWKQSTHVAAISYVLSKQCTKLNPDEALLTGLLHSIGKLYILTRAEKHPELFQRSDTLNEILRDWHASIGRAILDNWDLPQIMAEAVAQQDDLARVEDAPADLRDVIAVSILMASFTDDPAAMGLSLTGLAPVTRLGLTIPQCAEIMRASAAEVAALCQALGR